MNVYRVKVKIVKYEHFEVEAESAATAMENWGLGELVAVSDEDFTPMRAVML